MADVLQQKIAQLAAKIDAQTAKSRRAQLITIIVGIVFIVALLAYFGYMSGLTRSALEPEGVASVLTDKINEQVKGLNTEAQTFIKAEAPKIIDDLISKAINEQIPEGRESLETAIKTESSKLLQKYEDEIYKGVDETLAKYGSNIKEFAVKLRTEEGTAEFADSLYNVIDEAVKSEEIQLEMETYGEALLQVDSILNRLVNDTDLNEDEQSLLHLLQVVREITRRSELNTLSVDLSVDVETPGVDAAKEAK